MASSDKVNQVTKTVDNVKLQMNENLQKQTQNLAGVDNLQKKANEMENSAAVYQNSSTELKNKALYDRYKMIGMFVGIVITLIIVCVMITGMTGQFQDDTKSFRKLEVLDHFLDKSDPAYVHGPATDARMI